MISTRYSKPEKRATVCISYKLVSCGGISFLMFQVRCKMSNDEYNALLGILLMTLNVLKFFPSLLCQGFVDHQMAYKTFKKLIFCIIHTLNWVLGRNRA